VGQVAGRFQIVASAQVVIDSGALQHRTHGGSCK
jgi:hypothetical protein